MKNKTLAIFGIGAYVLSVLSSATDLAGNPTVPVFLVIISGVCLVVFVAMVAIRLWSNAKYVSILFPIFAILVVLVIPAISLTDGSMLTLLLNIAKVIYLALYIYVLVKLFSTRNTPAVQNT